MVLFVIPRERGPKNFRHEISITKGSGGWTRTHNPFQDARKMAEHYEDNKRKAHAKDERGEDPPSPPSALAYADRSRKGFRRVAESLVHVIMNPTAVFPVRAGGASPRSCWTEDIRLQASYAPTKGTLSVDSVPHNRTQDLVNARS